METINGLIYILAAWNAVTFLLYGLDKWKARRGWRRISERTLILLAFCMGGAGGWLGMRVFRHKTKHMSFRILLPLAVAANAAAVILGLYLYRLMTQ